jgi:flagellar motor component MotA
MKNSTKYCKILLSTTLLLILTSCSLSSSSEKKSQKKLKDIYAVLKIECRERSKVNNYDHIAKDMNKYMQSCCLESVEEMERHKYKEAEENTNCPKGFHLMQLKCPGTLAWCEADGLNYNKF